MGRRKPRPGIPCQETTCDPTRLEGSALGVICTYTTYTLGRCRI